MPPDKPLRLYVLIITLMTFNCISKQFPSVHDNYDLFNFVHRPRKHSVVVFKKGECPILQWLKKVRLIEVYNIPKSLKLYRD